VARIGLFGGSFDPPHIGHWLVAVDAYEALGLTRLDFVPTAHQPLKLDGHRASATDRVAMVRAMVGDDPRFRVSTVETDRGGLSFMVDTLRAYRHDEPDAELFLLLGADAVASLPQWKRPEEVVRLAQVCMLTRGSAAGAVPPVFGAQVRSVATRRVDLSATEVRARVAAGKSITGFVSERVAAHIVQAALYR
jgi:nicotinate-nucleotide adenylyltransferase